MHPVIFLWRLVLNHILPLNQLSLMLLSQTIIHWKQDKKYLLQSISYENGKTNNQSFWKQSTMYAHYTFPWCITIKFESKNNQKSCSYDTCLADMYPTWSMCGPTMVNLDCMVLEKLTLSRKHFKWHLRHLKSNANVSLSVSNNCHMKLVLFQILIIFQSPT